MLEKICIILLVNLLFYAKTIGFKYSSDDIPIFLNPPITRNFWEKIIFWIDGRRRAGPAVDHALTILLHAIVCVLIFIGFGKNSVSFIAALLFSINPTNNQGSVWISGRGYVLAALGITGALAFPYISFAFLLIACYTNAGFIGPLVFVGSSLLPFMWGAAPLAWLINWKRFSKNVSNKMQLEMLTEDKAIKPEKIVLVLKTFGFYTILALIPFQNAFYHSFLQSSSGAGRFRAYSMKDRFFWLGLCFASAIVAYWFMTPWSMISFGLLWWCVCLAPFLNFMRMSQETAERYCYLPAVGLMFVLATALINHPVLISGILMMYATRMWFLMDMYQDDYYLLEHACLQDPSSWFVWHIRGIKRWDNQSFQEAVIIWTMARRISPNEFKININLATILASHNRMEEAKFYLKTAEDNIPPGQERASSEILSRWKKGDMCIIQ